MLVSARFPRRPDFRPETVRGSTPTPESVHAWPPERKLRLFACGCCRQWWETLAPVCRRAVGAAERYADGRCTVAELETAWRDCRAAEGRGLPDAPGARTTEYVHRVAAAVVAPADARTVATDLRPWRGDSADNTEVDAVCARVEADVFGGIAVLSPDWLTSTVRDLARTMYELRDFSAMPILADALQDAGCDDENVLAHCRAALPGGGSGERPVGSPARPTHVRGCWVVDLVLGK